MAPEVIRQTGYGSPADIWSVGCTVVEMATENPPWAGLSTHVAAMWAIAQAREPPAYPPWLSADAVDFLNLCFNRDPSKRPTAAQLIEHSFVVKEYTPDAKTIEMIAQYRKNRRRLSENPSTEASQQVSDTENPDLDGEDEVGDLDSYDSYVA